LNRHDHGQLPYLTFSNLEAYPGLLHAVFTRIGGVSAPPYATLNQSYAVGDRPECVIANRELACAQLGLGMESLTSTYQAHGLDIRQVRRGDRGTGAYPTKGLPRADALITDEPEVPLLMRFADCTPIILYDPVHHAVGLAHAGWKGTVGKIAQRTVEAMQGAFDSDPETMVAALGPGIGPCCYVVRDDVASLAKAAFTSWREVLVSLGDGLWRFDLYRANWAALASAGVPPANVELAEYCTSCRTDLFFSHRAENGRTGRFGVIVGLRQR